ncbi:MAG: hypothetical protein COA44_14065 [Arcobacter sp.]|nr:MAG: hypothetical protein COA44_14065 [Arcobacter sp.]
MIKKMTTAALTILVLGAGISGCGEKKEEKASVPGMKCGADKCGANMFDGNSALAKKKKNILKQMREDDPRKDCVIAAITTKDAYNCVREPNGKKLIMKCGVGKCGSEKDRAKEPEMKCGAGKCGGSM